MLRKTQASQALARANAAAAAAAAASAATTQPPASHPPAAPLHPTTATTTTTRAGSRGSSTSTTTTLGSYPHGGGGAGGGRAPSPAAASSSAAAMGHNGGDVDEDGMLLRGLGMAAAANNGGGATVRVTLFDRRGECFKVSKSVSVYVRIYVRTPSCRLSRLTHSVLPPPIHTPPTTQAPMTLSQIRRHIVDRASTTQQDWLYRQAPLFGAVLAALVPRVYQLYQLFSPRPRGSGHGDGDDATTGPAVCVLMANEGVVPPLLLWAVRGVSMATVFALALGMFRQLSVTEYTYKRRYKYSKYFAVRFLGLGFFGLFCVTDYWCQMMPSHARLSPSPQPQHPTKT